MLLRDPHHWRAAQEGLQDLQAQVPQFLHSEVVPIQQQERMSTLQELIFMSVQNMLLRVGIILSVLRNVLSDCVPETFSWRSSEE